MEPPNQKRKAGGMSPGAIERRRCEKMRVAQAMFGEMPDEDLLEEYSPRTAMGRTMQRRADEEAAQAAANGNEENEGGMSPLTHNFRNKRLCETCFKIFCEFFANFHEFAQVF